MERDIEDNGVRGGIGGVSWDSGTGMGVWG